MQKGLFIYLLVVLFGAGSAYAQQGEEYGSNQSYGEWGNKDRSLGNMIGELNRLIDKAESERAADRYFLRDLRDLARKYDSPLKSTIIDDDFRDGEFTKNPAWTVVSGEFTVDQYGLRSRSNISSEPNDSSSSKSREGDLGGALLGMLLEKMDEKSSKQQPAEKNKGNEIGEIHLSKKISNVFSIQLDMGVVNKDHRLEWGVYQRDDRQDGYRLKYIGGANPALEMVRLTSRGQSVIETRALPGPIADGKNHIIEWTRNAYADMSVTIDGVEILQVSDRGFLSEFNGFTLINHGGEYSIRRVVIQGT